MTLSGRSRSFGGELARHNGLAPGFDVLRLGLALLIFTAHCKWIAGSGSSVAGLGAEATDLVTRGWSGYRRPFQVALVPMFFALSGFLVTASAFRVREVHRFLALRALRIFPALTVEVTLSALLLGPLLTSLAADAYFLDRSFFTYFGNILGFVSFELPGVFQNNHVKGIVNANLWTLPAEFYCYLFAASAMAAGVAFDRRWFTAAFAVATVLAVTASFTMGFGVSETYFGTAVLVYYFFAGCLLYHWRDEIPCSWLYFVVAGALSYGLLYFREAVFLAPLPLVYVTVWLGLANIPALPALRNADYSYGIYLYGFPIAQALIATRPELQGHGWWLAAIAGFLTISFAAFSWHVIEAPMLSLKRYVPRSRSAEVAALQPG